MNKIVPFMLIFFFISGLFVGIFSSVSATDRADNSWNAKAPMKLARSALGVVAVDDKIYAIGGYIKDSTRIDDVVGINECYSPESDTWVTLEPMPTPRAGFSISAYEDKIYCIGGMTRDYRAESVWPIWPCNVNEAYDAITNRWSTKASAPFNATNLQTHVVNGKIFVITERTTYIYDPITDSWTEKGFTTIDDDLSITSSAVVNNKIMVCFSSRMNDKQKVMFYDSINDLWREGATSSSMFKGATGVTSGSYAPQKIYVMGFIDAQFSNTSYTNQVYDPVSDTWSIGKAMLTYRSFFGVAVVDDILYIIGGSFHGGEPSAINEQYVPIGFHGTLPTGTKFPLNKTTIATIAIPLSIGIIAGLIFFFRKKQEACGRYRHFSVVRFFMISSPKLFRS